MDLLIQSVFKYLLLPNWNFKPHGFTKWLPSLKIQAGTLFFLFFAIFCFVLFVLFVFYYDAKKCFQCVQLQ